MLPVDMSAPTAHLKVTPPASPGLLDLVPPAASCTIAMSGPRHRKMPQTPPHNFSSESSPSLIPTEHEHGGTELSSVLLNLSRNRDKDFLNKGHSEMRLKTESKNPAFQTTQESSSHMNLKNVFVIFKSSKSACFFHIHHSLRILFTNDPLLEGKAVQNHGDLMATEFFTTFPWKSDKKAGFAAGCQNGLCLLDSLYETLKLFLRKFHPMTFFST